MTKRRDTKGRILRDGEYQRKDGRYEYKYTDITGERHSYYSWQLVPTDPIPQGKHCPESLREIEDRLFFDKHDGIDSLDAQNATVDDVFERLINLKSNLRETSLNTYRSMYDTHIKPQFGKVNISSIRYSHIKSFYLKLLKNKKISTVTKIHGLFYSIFNLAVRDDICRKNPANGIMREIKAGGQYKIKKREALTIRQQEILINYIYGSDRFKRYGNFISFLLGTGCRIGEAIGLRWEDVDFQGNFISINHSAAYHKCSDGTYSYSILPPKTDAGYRVIPMLGDIKNILVKERTHQSLTGVCHDQIDGYNGFIFTNSNGTLLHKSSVDRVLRDIVNCYNANELNAAITESREAELLPDISAHILRHTFCTRLCENDVNISVIKDIMGHSDIKMTLEVYNTVTQQRKTDNFSILEGKIKIV